MTFKIYDCDFGVTINGVNYDFTHVNSITIEDNEKTRLVRGSNAGNKTGLPYKEGLRDAKIWTVSVIELGKDLFNLLRACYTDQTRVDCYCISRPDGSAKIAKNAVLSQEPQQLTVDESADSLNVSLVFESFDVSENHKS